MTMGPELEVFITNRFETIRRQMFQYEDLEVEHTLSDSRTCKFSAPIYDINSLHQSNIQHFIPMRRLVKVFYRSRLIFWGPILKPRFNLRENKVEVNAHDPSIWWKNHHFSEQDSALSGVKVNGAGLWDLIGAANLNPAEAALGFASPGVVLGVGQDYLLPGESAGDRRIYKASRGTSVYDGVQEMATSADGPDWELVPIDAEHDPFGVYVPGLIAALRARREISRERQDTVIFHYGFGRLNLENFIFEPDGVNIQNRFVAQNSRGGYKVAKYLEGMEHDGIMESWEDTPGKGFGPAALEEFARRNVEAYGLAPPTFTIEPMWDQGLMGSALGTPWRYPTGYKPGDRIRVIAKLGEFYEDHIGRVIKTTLKQQNAAENVQTSVECIPEPVSDIDVQVDNNIS